MGINSFPCKPGGIRKYAVLCLISPEAKVELRQIKVKRGDMAVMRPSVAVCPRLLVRTVQAELRAALMAKHSAELETERKGVALEERGAEMTLCR